MAKKPKTKWKWNEFNEWKQHKEQADEPEEQTVRPGQCPDCGNGSFQLKVNKGRMDRVCKNCGVITENV